MVVSGKSLFFLPFGAIPLTHSACRWKYGLLEVHTILVKLLQSFEFLESGAELFNGIALVSLIPVVKGREHEGVQVPVLVKALTS